VWIAGVDLGPTNTGRQLLQSNNGRGNSNDRGNNGNDGRGNSNERGNKGNDGRGNSRGDPLIQAFDGSLFFFHGEPGKIYNLASVVNAFQVTLRAFSLGHCVTGVHEAWSNEAKSLN
jgi:hypothetical protein